MFNIGGGEFLVIALIALIVLGPQRLPDAARQIGKTMGELRRISSGFQNELRSALDDDGAAPTARRNVLAKEVESPPAEAEAPVTAALDSVSAQTTARVRKPRRTPLQAAPAEGTAARRRPIKAGEDISPPSPRRSKPE
jgi:Tat protein translocase TatB subunit